MEKKLNQSETRFTVKVDHTVNETEQIKVELLMKAAPSNPRFANRFEEAKEKMYLASHRAAIEAWHEICDTL